MSNPKNQHYVPACYLREFTDPVDGFLHIYSKDGKEYRKQKPEKTFRSNHLYTITVNGTKDYRIENSLAWLEGKYAEVFKKRIKKKLPLSEYDHVIFCTFVAAQLQRTLRAKKNQEQFIEQMIEHGEQVARARGLEFADKNQWEGYKKDIHKIQLFENLSFLTNILVQMSLAFLCSKNPKKKWFITSDEPCVLFNPDLQWQKFYSPGFAQKNVQLTIPLSPEITALFCWANYKGYSTISGRDVDEMINRMTRSTCYREFVTPHEKKKFIWFMRVPLDIFFIAKAIRIKTEVHVRNYLNRKRYGRFRK